MMGVHMMASSCVPISGDLLIYRKSPAGRTGFYLIFVINSYKREINTWYTVTMVPAILKSVNIFWKPLKSVLQT